MRRFTTLAVVVLLVAVAPGGALAAPAATDASSPNTTLATQSDCSYPVTRTDATGTAVTVSEEPERVVTLGESAAQIMWELDAESKVVGLPTGPTTAYLEGSQDRTNIRNQDGTVNREQVVGLQPDLVLAPNIVPDETVTALRDAGLTVYKVDLDKSLASIPTKTALYGRFVNACDQARQVNTEFNDSIAEIRENAPDQRPRVYYYFFNFTTGNETFIHEAIQTAGGDNVAANAGVRGYREVNTEIVADRNPQWVVRPQGSPLPSGAPWDSTTAYGTNQTLTVDNNLISQPGPRVVEPMEAMQAAFRNTSTMGTPTPTPADGESPTPTPADGDDGGDGDGMSDGDDGGANASETTTGSGPGFGVVAGIVAALSAAALLARRD